MLELLLPQRCLGCGRGGTSLCEACRAALAPIVPPLCARCGAPTAWPVERCSECSGRRLAFTTARAAVAYDDRMRRIVAGWKEHGLRRLAREAALLVAEACERPDVDVLTSVPPDRERRLERGHHPAERLASELGAVWDLPVAVLLRRRGRAPRQRGLSVEERRRNVRGAFTAASSARRVGLVDDVYTTGATASAAASALRRAGAEEVRVLTVARTLRLR